MNTVRCTHDLFVILGNCLLLCLSCCYKYFRRNAENASLFSRILVVFSLHRVYTVYTESGSCKILTFQVAELAVQHFAANVVLDTPRHRKIKHTAIMFFERRICSMIRRVIFTPENLPVRYNAVTGRTRNEYTAQASAASAAVVEATSVGKSVRGPISIGFHVLVSFLSYLHPHRLPPPPPSNRPPACHTRREEADSLTLCELTNLASKHTAANFYCAMEVESKTFPIPVSA